MFKTDATVRFGQILSAIELLGMGNFNEYLLLLLLEQKYRVLKQNSKNNIRLVGSQAYLKMRQNEAGSMSIKKRYSTVILYGSTAINYESKAIDSVPGVDQLDAFPFTVRVLHRVPAGQIVISDKYLYSFSSTIIPGY